jgi:hypothetical protein
MWREVLKIMSFAGHLSAFPIHSILQILSEKCQSGILTVNHHERQVRIQFLNGEIVRATGWMDERRLGQILKKKGLITEQRLQEALGRAILEAQCLGKSLAEAHLVDEKALKEALREQVCELICDIHFWEEGEFEFSETAVNLDGMLNVAFSPIQLLIEASRRMDEMAAFRSQNITNRTVFARSDRIYRQKQIKLNGNEWRVLALLDGQRTVEDLMDPSGCSQFELYKALNAILHAGFIDPLATAPAPPPPAVSGSEKSAQQKKSGLFSIFRKKGRAATSNQDERSA